MEDFQHTNEYKFLVKPVFFIISLLITGYLVLRLEMLQPKDVGLGKDMSSIAKEKAAGLNK